MLYHNSRPPKVAALLSPPLGVNGAAIVTTPAVLGPSVGFVWGVNADLNNKRIRDGHIVSNNGIRGVVASVGNGRVLVKVGSGRGRWGAALHLWDCHSVRVVDESSA